MLARALAPQRSQAPHGAVAVLAAQRAAIERRLQRLSSSGVPPWPTTVRESLLALELRCKLEEQLVFPALYEARACDSHTVQAEQASIAMLRTLADKTQLSAGQPVGQRLLFAALEGAAALHFDAVDGLLAAHADSSIDWDRLGRQMNGLLERWREELEETGDIEDEDRDPVGLAPRN